MDPFTIASLALAGTELVRGISGNSKANKMRKEYDSYEQSIPMQDPAQITALGDTRRRMDALRRGSDPMTALGMQQARENLVNTQGNIVKSGRGNMSDLLKSQRNADLGMSSIAARGNAAADALMPLEGSLVNSMASRAYNRQMARARFMFNEYSNQRQMADSRIQAGLGMLPNIAGGFGKRAAPTGPVGSATMTDQINKSLPAGRAMSDGGLAPVGSGMGMFPYMANQPMAQPAGQPAPVWWSGAKPAWWQ
jgi:hypothetical protein